MVGKRRSCFVKATTLFLSFVEVLRWFVETDKVCDLLLSSV